MVPFTFCIIALNKKHTVVAAAAAALQLLLYYCTAVFPSMMSEASPLNYKSSTDKRGDVRKEDVCDEKDKHLWSQHIPV